MVFEIRIVAEVGRLRGVIGDVTTVGLLNTVYTTIGELTMKMTLSSHPCILVLVLMASLKSPVRSFLFSLTKSQQVHGIALRSPLSTACRLVSNDDGGEIPPADDDRTPQHPVSELGTSFAEQPLSLFDKTLLWVVSDVGSLVLGILGILIVLVGRLLTPLPTLDNDNVDSLAEETRINLLAILACGSVLSNGLSKLDINSVTAETVQLTGTLVKPPVILLDDDDDVDNNNNNCNVMKKDYSWLIQAVLTATSARTAVILERHLSSTETKAMPTGRDGWQVLGYGGTVSDMLLSSAWNGELGGRPGPIVLTDRDDATPILNRFVSKRSPDQERNQETYLPNLPALPGRIEFYSFLPGNTQAALLMPMTMTRHGCDTVRVVVLGSNQARSFTPRDIAWCRAAVDGLQQ